MRIQDDISSKQLLLDCVKGLSLAVTMGDVEKTFLSLTKRYGFSDCVAARLSCDGNNLSYSIVNQGGNPAWLERYDSRNYVFYDDCLRFFPSSKYGFTWQEILKGPYSSPRGKCIMLEAKEFGFTDGLVIPVRSYNGSNGIVTISSTLGEYSFGERTILEIAAICFYENLLRVQNFSLYKNSAKLTKRQVEVIKWLADGKRYDDIADILSISIKTVERHIEDAKIRLGVMTRDQLVLSAYRSGMLDIG